MRDIPPELCAKKLALIELCREVFERYGFRPLETPVLEYLDTLTKKGSAGEQILNEIYAFEDRSGRKLGMRFDLTVPLARFVAANPQLPLPFKRYQIGRVYRYDRPQAKRYREFTQADVDIVGGRSVLCEFECIAVACEIMKKLNQRFTVQVNSRELLEAIALANDVPKEKLSSCFVAIDKLDKIGEEGVREELNQRGLSEDVLDALLITDMDEFEQLITGMKQAERAYGEIKQLFSLAERFGFVKNLSFSPTLARGLDYYTGMVFEIKLDEGPSVGGGGRYDKLIGLFSGRSLPAVGISFGIDRLLDSVQRVETRVVPQVLVFAVSEELMDKALEIAQALRKKMSCELDLMGRSISKNLQYANSKGIPFVVIVGKKELEQGMVILRNMESGKQHPFPIDVLCKEPEKIFN